MSATFFGHRPLEVQDWGHIPYREAWARQRELVERRIKGEIPDTMVFCEHDPVITIGRGGQRGERPVIFPPPGTDVVDIERGGLATWHGPGQVVAYPIMKLDRGAGFGVLALIRALEAWVVDYLGAQGLKAGIIDGKTGVWIDGERKIASIGIAVSHWVSYHGLSLNFATGMDPWRCFNPCGFDAEVMTDLRKETKRAIDYRDVVRDLAASLK